MKETINKCPWCGSNRNIPWSKDSLICECGIIFIHTRPTQKGVVDYYRKYFSNVHQADETLNEQRKIMYQIEYDFIAPYLKGKSKILDVGCGDGSFLDFFKGHDRYGVEVGEEASGKSKHTMFLGDLLDLNIPSDFDLIIFRGVIEHLRYPKVYLLKATSLLNNGGLIYITSTPNSDSLCCQLFKDKWTMHRPDEHLIHFSAGHIDNFMEKKNFSKVSQYSFYRETPYADLDNDLRKITKAIAMKAKGDEINFTSPAFYGNMMTLVYRKELNAIKEQADSN